MRALRLVVDIRAQLEALGQRHQVGVPRAVQARALFLARVTNVVQCEALLAVHLCRREHVLGHIAERELEMKLCAQLMQR